jgi:hypothetical protein
MSLDREGSSVVGEGKPIEEPVEVKVSKCGGDELTVFTVEEGEIAVVHPSVIECLGEALVQHKEWWGLFDPPSSCGVGCMFVNEVRLEVVSVFE